MNRRDFIHSTLLASLAFSIGSRKLLSVTPEKSEDLFTYETREFLKTLYEKAQKNNWRDMPFGDLVGTVGYEFLGTQYEAGTLEGKTEICRVLLDRLDCVTFFETSLAIATQIMKQKYSVKDLILRVGYTRYRGGLEDGYLTRLHYTADWIHDNIQKGIIYDVTEELGGEEYVPNVSFMSKNPNYYPPLKENPELVEEIEKIELDINSRNYYYIPKDKVEMIEPMLMTGDIIAITTPIEGLDYGHVGMIYKIEDDTARFLHASSEQKKVVLDDTISKYLARNKRQTGITVLRPTYSCPLDVEE